MGKGTSFILPFVKKEQVAKDTYTFYFERGKFSKFLPGQYIHLEIPHKADDRGTTRYFTISSSPLNKEYLTITTKVIRSSFKKALFHLKPGTKVNAFGPMGWFLLPKDEKEEKIFLAGGIGVTPFHSLLTTLVVEKLVAPIILIVSFSNPESAIFYDELMDITNKNSQIRVVYNYEHISENTIKKYVSDLQKPVYYVTGPEVMVAETKALLVNLNIDEEKIQTEDFTGY